MKTHITTTLSVLAVLCLGIGTQVWAGEQAPAVQVHGYMQNRFYAAQGANPQFRSERISVCTTAALPGESQAYVELYYHPWAPASGLYVESAYYDTQFGPGHIRVGKGRRQTFGITPYWGNRRTTNYGIVGEAITQDRIQGVQYMVQSGALDLGVSAHTNYRLGTRPIGEVPGDARHNALHSVPHLSLRDNPGALGDNLQFSGRLGGRWTDGPNGLKLGVSGSIANLDPTDQANLATSAGNNPLTPGGTPALLPAATDKRMVQFGPDLTYRHPSGLVLQGELYFAEASNLTYAVGNALVGWELPSGWKAFARYGFQEMHTPTTANPLSWDTGQLSLSVVQPLRKGLWLQYEYEKNLELIPSAMKVKNDLFLVELFTGF